MSHKAGFVSIIGRPNVGKSTLMNALVGERLSIISPKAQTTRHRILGIWNDEEHQVVFSDTPGILDPGYKLQETMMTAVNDAIKDAEILIYMVELGESVNEMVVDRIKKINAKLALVINKVDDAEQKAVEQKILDWHTALPEATVIPLSALHHFNTLELMEWIKIQLPEHPPYFDKEDLTDRPVRFFVAEIIRGKILKYYKKEIPYAVEVVVEEYKEEPGIIHIHTAIYVTRETQKMIIIGEGGRAIKRMATDARRDIQTFLGSKVFLETTVKVKKDWRDNDRDLKQFGYL
jgi:GTP-binding protein Era